MTSARPRASGPPPSAGATAAVTLCLMLLGCGGQPPQQGTLPPLRDRNYLCQMPGIGETHEDEVACEDNKRPLMDR